MMTPGHLVTWRRSDNLILCLLMVPDWRAQASPITAKGYSPLAPSWLNQLIIASLPGWLRVRCGQTR